MLYAIYINNGVGNFVYSFLDVVIHNFPCVTGPSTYSIILCTHYILLFTNWLTSFIQYSGGRLGKKVPYAPRPPSLKLIINTVLISYTPVSYSAIKQTEKIIATTNKNIFSLPPKFRTHLCRVEKVHLNINKHRILALSGA